MILSRSALRWRLRRPERPEALSGHSTALRASARVARGRVGACTRRWWPIALIAVVILVDQGSKWIAGHAGLSAYLVNSGADRDWPGWLSHLAA
ncbi:MAG: hypothetical protein M3Y17_07860, partial [Actinomycetota bacterium]|nr:hypothetical protein [Actinomycetota bacterium]